MAGMKTIIALAFLLSSGMLSAILACALGNNWLPLIGVLTMVFAPFPNIICTRAAESSEYMGEDNRGLVDAGYFITSFFVVSGVALPIVLSHAGIISTLALILSVSGGVLIYLTIVGYVYNFVEYEQDIYI